MSKNKEVKEKKEKSKLKVWLIRSILFLLFLPLLISILFQFSFFQNYIAQETTQYLSDKMGTKVTISRIDVSIFDGVILDKFTLIDSEKNDTVIFANNLSVSLSKNIFSLFNKSLSISSIKLDKPIVNLIIDKETGKSNLEKYLSRIISQSDGGDGSALKLDIKDISVVQARFKILNERNNQIIRSNLEEGKIKINSINFENNTFIVESINLIRPTFLLKKGTDVIKDKKAKSISGNPLCLSIMKLNIREAYLKIDGLIASENIGSFDPNNLEVKDVNLDLTNLNYGGISDLYANINSLNAEFGNSDFMLEELSIPEFIINQEGIYLKNFLIKTKESLLQKNVIVNFDEFVNIRTSVENGYLLSDLVDSKISLNEVSYFLPGIKKSLFFQKNRNEVLEIDGKLTGKLNNLKGNEVALRFSDKFSFNGNFGIRNIENIEEALINLKVESLKSNVNFIADIIPGFNPPKNFYSLGKFDFSGFFDGYVNNFVTQGKLITDIGTADLGVELNVKGGNENAEYKGDIKLTDFDLYKWSGGNANLGKVNLQAKVKDGKSLILKNATADLEAEIKLLQFKGYDYTNIILNGKISPNQFEGLLTSEDPNISLNFNGIVEFSEQRNKYDFTSSIKNLDLRKLNLNKNFSAIKGDIKFTGEGKNINDIVGKLFGSDLQLKKNDTLYVFDSVTINSKYIDALGNKSIEVLTEDAKISIVGKYNFNTLSTDIQSMVKNNFPYHTRNWNLKVKNVSPNQIFNYDISVTNAKQLLDLAGVKNLDINDFKAKGYINTKTSEISIASSLPVLAIDKNKFFDISLLFNNKLKTGDLFLMVDSSFVEGKELNKIEMQFDIAGDNIDFNIKAPRLIDSIQNFDLHGLISPHPKGYTMSLLDNDIRLFDRRWKINNESKISIGNKYINLENVVITDGSRMIQIEDIDDKGVYLALNQIDILSLNPLINYDKIQFGGILNSSISVSDIFSSSPKIDGNISIPRLTLNNDSYGEVAIDLTKAEGKPLDALISISNAESGQAIKISGKYDFDNKSVTADVKARKTPMKFLHYILKKGVSKVDGYIDIDADISGKLPDVKINGRGKAFGGAVRVIYLGETYYFDNQNFGITENRVDLAGAVIKDSEGNEGVISGGLNHTLFKDFYLDASIYAENVIAIKTSKFDNPIYYGIGRGRIEADFSGSVNTPKMVINAETTRGTNISIPIKETRTNSDKSFITFVDKKEFLLSKNDSLAKLQEVKIEGMTIELNLTMTQSSNVNLIFDELKNDVIRGLGNGNLRITMTPSGDFTMFGNYNITSGEYLFTAFDFVNKPFIVREGGTIRWTGDPVNASVNIEADYKVRTTLSSFLAEYLVTDDLKRAANVSTQVNLKLILGNTLYNPSVKFDLEFPELTGELKSYTDSKLRLLRNNDAEYNNQVFGLIVFNSFLPSNTLSGVGNNFIQNAGISTLSEFVSSQLSLFVTGLVNEALEENGLISGVDFDIALRNTTSFQGVSGATSFLPSEIEVRLKNKFRFLDERLSINIAGNYVRENTLITGLDNYIIPEFFVEYALSKDRQLNLKLYGKYDLDEISVTNRRQKFGIGLRYKNEFGSLVETKSKLSQGVRKVIIEEKDKK